jgi:hypothetical protein
MSIKNRPDGWATLKWGDAPSSLGNEGHVVSQFTDGMVVYGRQNETAILGNAEISDIKYYFKDEKLVMIDFVCEATSGNQRLLDYAIEQFGQPQLIEVNNDQYGWLDDYLNVFISMYSGKPAMMRFLLTSVSNGDTNPTFHIKPLTGKLDGFGGLKWGDSPNKLGDAKLIHNSAELKRSIYTKNNEITKFNGFGVKVVCYIFLESKLVFVVVTFADSATKEQLKNYTLKLLGNPYAIYNDGYKYEWIDDDFLASLQLSDTSGNNLVFGLRNKLYLVR